MDHYSILYPEENLFLILLKTWRNEKSKRLSRNDEENISSNRRAIQRQPGKSKQILKTHQELSKTERRTRAIWITTNVIKELTERLEELIEITNKYHTTKNINKTSETLINGWTILKNLAEEKKGDSMAYESQNNQGSYSHDLSSQWKWKMTKEWKDNDEPEYDTEKLLKARESTKADLRKKANRIQQAMNRYIARLLDPNNILMTQEEYADLQKAWKERQNQ